MTIDEPRVVAAPDERPVGRCPLCDGASRELDGFALSFAPRGDLPVSVRLEHCADCDFVFVVGVSAAAYRRHYESTRNDGAHVVAADGPDAHHRLQADQLAAILPGGFDGRVLDFGCGQGRLLATLAARFPNASLAGHDVANWLPSTSPARFVPAVDELDERFDLVVLSHVAEHLVDFDALQRVERLLAPGGLLYVEVPDPYGYIDCPRREFLYYVDRLHLNHFGPRAMRRLLGRFGLAVRRVGAHRFAYRDGPYPARCFVASRTSDRPSTAGSDEPQPLDRVFGAWRQRELARADALRRRLVEAGGGAGVLVHGAGDNFHRARSAGGPLDGMTLLAVMDRRAGEVGAVDGIPLARPADALEAFPDAPVVVTVSEGADAIVASIVAEWPDRRVFLA